MAELFLVRHGQASFGAQDYDALTELGRRQSRWLGDYFTERGMRFDHLYTGTLRRHRETAAAIAEGLDSTAPAAEHPGFDEYDFDALLRAFHSGADAAAVTDASPEAFYRTLKKALLRWLRGELPDGLPESWAQFGARVAEARRTVQAAASRGQRILVVSSGGPISRLLAQVLEAPDHQAVELNMQLYNTGLSRLYFNTDRIMLSSFNATPHLDRPGRFEAITYG